MGCIDRSKVFTPKNFPGSKSMPTAKHGAGSGKMSSAHGTGKSSPTKGMSNADNRVGHGTRGFKQNFKQGPCPIGDSGRKSSNSYHPKKGGGY